MVKHRQRTHQTSLKRSVFCQWICLLLYSFRIWSLWDTMYKTTIEDLVTVPVVDTWKSGKRDELAKWGSLARGRQLCCEKSLPPFLLLRTIGLDSDEVSIQHGFVYTLSELEQYVQPREVRIRQNLTLAPCIEIWACYFTYLGSLDVLEAKRLSWTSCQLYDGATCIV